MKVIKEDCIEEAKTSRIYRELTGGKTCAIISPYRTKYSEDENRRRLKKLKADVRSLGYGFVEFISRWVEDGESSDERSLLIYEIPFSVAFKLGKDFEQSSIIYRSGDYCEEVCVTPFEKYSPMDVVRTFDVSGDKVLNVGEAKEIFSRRETGPASMPVKGNRTPFRLKESCDEIYIVESPRASYFQTNESLTRVL